MNYVSQAPENEPRSTYACARDRAAPRWVIAAWVVLTLFGAFSAGQVSKRWFEASRSRATRRTRRTSGR